MNANQPTVARAASAVRWVVPSGRRLLLLALLVVAASLLAGCATKKKNAHESRRYESELSKVLDQAVLLLGTSRIRVDDRPYRSDCSGFVTACFEAAGVNLYETGVDGVSGTELIYNSLKKRGRAKRYPIPRAGDLAFFHNTWDRNENKIRDDHFTHIALVEGVDDDGTVRLVHFASGKVGRALMNLEHPSKVKHPDSGRLINSYLRKGGDRVLAAQLFYRFARPLPSDR